MVILEFPCKADVLAWFEDPEYVAAVKFRHAALTASIYIQEGGSNTENPNPHV